MEFKNLSCARCHQIQAGAPMRYFQNCYHFFCYPCFGGNTTCLICKIGQATDTLSDTLLADVVNLVSGIYSTFTSRRIETGPGNEELNSVPDAVLLSEPKTEKKKMKPLPNDTPGTSFSTLRRTQRTRCTNPEPGNKPDTEKLIKPPGKRRRNQVSMESPTRKSSALEKNGRKALQPSNKVLKTEVSELASSLHDAIEKNVSEVEELQENERTKPEPDNKPDPEKLIQPAGKRRRNQVATESPPQKSSALEKNGKKALRPSNKVLKTEVRELTSPMHVAIEKQGNEVDELQENDVERLSSESDNKPVTEKSVQPAGKRRRNQVATESPPRKSSALEKNDKKALRPYNKVAKTELSDLTSPGITSKKNRKKEGTLHAAVKKIKGKLVKKLLDPDVHPTNPESEKKPDVEKLVATEPAVKKTSEDEESDQKKLALDRKMVKKESNLTSPGVTPKNTYKNGRGETPLHVAVKKNKVELVQELLENGTDPNVQDYAGWTPLHDAVTKGFAGIISCLLKHGALADIPGYENDTALHIAVEKLDKPLVVTLLKHGANPVAKNLYGVTPIAVAEKSGDQQLINLLSSHEKSDKKPKVMAIAPAEPITLFIGLLRNDQQTIVRKFAKQFKFKIESDIYKASCVVSNPDPAMEWGLTRVMAKGSHIISSDWCEKSLATGQLQVIEKFFIYPEWLPGLSAAQNNSSLKRPGLFSGCEIKLGNTPQMLKKSEKYQWNNMAIVLNDLCRFVEAADGKLINRMPDPENPFRPSTVPYHVQPGPMEHCSQIVIYFPGLWEPALKFNMGHLKCLPITWLMDCILSSELKSATDCYFTA